MTFQIYAAMLLIPLYQTLFKQFIFLLLDPPENIQVSLNLIDIVEGETPEDVICSASAFPPGHYLWTVGDTVLSRSHILTFNASVTRDMAGNYSCNVRNTHGHARADLVLMVNRKSCILNLR